MYNRETIIIVMWYFDWRFNAISVCCMKSLSIVNISMILNLSDVYDKLGMAGLL